MFLSGILDWKEKGSIWCEIFWGAILLYPQIIFGGLKQYLSFNLDIECSKGKDWDKFFSCEERGELTFLWCLDVFLQNDEG